MINLVRFEIFLSTNQVSKVCKWQCFFEFFGIATIIFRWQITLKQIPLIALVILLSGCSVVADYISPPKPFSFPSDQTQTQRRSYQTRKFEVVGEKQSLKIIIATLQDLGFTITKVDAELGVVTGKQIYNNSDIYISVTANFKPPNFMFVRASLQDNHGLVDSPEIYQDFFSYLQKSYFLAENEIN